VKVWAANRALEILGHAYAFSLNLSPNVINAANDNDRGHLDLVRRPVLRELKKALGRDVHARLILETTHDGRLHLHGGLALNDNEIPTTERALNHAGGLWRGKGAEQSALARCDCDPSSRPKARRAISGL
jgi:hypothetical protein